MYEVSLSAKKKNDRSKFLSAFMREISGDFGKEIIDDFVNGRTNELMEKWNEVGEKIKKKSYSQKSSKKSQSSSSGKKFKSVSTVRTIKDTNILVEPSVGDARLVVLSDKKGKVLLSLEGGQLEDAVKKGYVDSSDWHESMYEYAKQIKVIQ